MAARNRAFSMRAGTWSCVLAAVALLVLAVGGQAWAANGTWGVDASGAWSTVGNWSGGVVADGTGSSASFTNDITSDVTVTLDSARSINAVVFGDAAGATAGSWTIDDGGVAANVLTLGGTSPSITVNNTLGAGKSATISADMAFATGVNVFNSGTLNITGSISGGQDLNLRTGTTNISGAGNTIAGKKFTLGFFSSATATWADVAGTFSTNWFGIGDGGGTSSLTMGSGSISVQDSATLGLFVGSGSTGSLILNGGSFTVSSQNVFLGAGLNGTGNGTGTLTLGGGQFAFTGGGSFALGGSATASGTINLNSGTLSLNGRSITKGSGSANVNFNGGTLRLTATNAAVFGAGVNPTVAAGGGVIDTNGFNATIATNLLGGAGAGNLTKAGSGTLTLSGSAATYAGTVVVQNGSLSLANGGAIAAGGGIRLGTTGTTSRPTLELAADASGLSLTLDASLQRPVVIRGGAGTRTWDGDIVLTSTGSEVVQIDTAGGDLVLDGTITGGLNGQSLLLRGTGGTGTLAADVNIGTTPLVKTDTGGSWEITSTGNTWGSTLVAAGTLELGATGALPSGTAVTMAEGANPATLDLASFDATIGSLAGARADSTVALGGGTLTTGGSGATTSYAGVISGTGGLTKQGVGTFTLSGANSFTGPTTVAAGTLTLAATGSLASTEIAVEAAGTLDVSAVTGFALGSGQRLGGAGTILGSLEFGSGSTLAFGLADTLTVSSGTVSFFAGTPGSRFGIDDVVGLDVTTPLGTYTLFNGSVDTTNLDNLGSGNAYTLGSGKSAYFEVGSLDVVVVPEPGALAWMSAAIAAVGLIRRRCRMPAGRTSAA